jgi:1-acyl-sn-glycerol-3-phosphate acyltransferase
VQANVTGTTDRATVERLVLDTVGGLVGELGTTPARGSVALGDALDRDLGIGSLERVELVTRLELALGARLGDAVITEAETCHDVVTAVLEAEAVAPGAIELAPVVAPGTPAPATARTLTEVLRWHAERHPERVHVVLRSGDGPERSMTYGELWRQATGVATALGEHGIGRSESVALMLPTGLAFFPVFLGTLLAGAVPVPIYPPVRAAHLEEYARRQAGILRNAGARLLITFQPARRVAALLRRRVPSLERLLAADELVPAGPGRISPPTDGEAPALIQYTSGSTGDPKGVLLSHANLLANIRALGEAVAVKSDDIMVSWLPLYHDMGLIGAWLAPMYHGVPAVILPPLAFLASPVRWLQALHAHRGTVSPAPNFAFDLCVKRITDAELEGLDLRAWRLALNGSEPVSVSTIERFSRRFARCGFRPEAMCPVYGLAEVSVGLTVSPPGRGPRVDRVAREPFERARRAEPALDDATSPLTFVSCGTPLSGHQVRIVDRAGRLLPERVEGHVQFRGPSVTKGYFRNPEATRTVQHEGWMDSGDLGYWADGELYITGRQKDLIIKAGRNLYPQEIEEIVGDVPGVRKGCVAAFGVMDPRIGTERLIVVAETRVRLPEEEARLRASILDALVAALGMPADLVVLTEPGTVLKTSSGKIRRSATRDAHVAGRLGRERRSARAPWARLVVREAGEALRRLGRRLVSGAWAAYVGALLVLTLPVLWGLALALPSGRAVDRLARVWCRRILALAGCPVVVEGVEHLPRDSTVVLAPNHTSYVDTMALLAVIPIDFRFVAKRELLRTPVVGTIIAKVGHLAVDRVDLTQSVADAARVSETLRRGTSLLFFPEGTFVRSPGLLPFRLGAFKAAVEAHRPVVPIALRGPREILPADAWLPRRGSIRLSIGAPIAPEGEEWRDIVRLRDRVRAEIAARLEADGVTPS